MDGGSDTLNTHAHTNNDTNDESHLKIVSNCVSPSSKPIVSEKIDPNKSGNREIFPSAYIGFFVRRIRDNAFSLPSLHRPSNRNDKEGDKKKDKKVRSHNFDHDSIKIDHQTKFNLATQSPLLIHIDAR